MGMFESFANSEKLPLQPFPWRLRIQKYDRNTRNVGGKGKTA